MFDKFGVELKEGDQIIYTTGGQSEYGLHIGVIVSIFEDKAKIKDFKTGRNKQRMRREKELINLEGFKLANPELFI